LDEREGRGVGRVVEAIVAWAKTRADICGVALVGSLAIGKARAHSDIDLVLLTNDPHRYRSDLSWVGAIDWRDLAAGDLTWSDEDYAVVWSRRILLGQGLEAELSFAPLTWAATAPLDAGTRRVVSDGCQILYDPAGLLDRLCKAAKRLSPNAAQESGD
jgi:uncharacterized protein